jgi:hypothetical protein
MRTVNHAIRPRALDLKFADFVFGYHPGAGQIR